MSAIQQMMLAGSGRVTVTGSLSGSGSLSIPAGVTSIVLTGNGGPGTPPVDHYGWTLNKINNPYDGSDIKSSAYLYFVGPDTPSASSSGYAYQFPSSFRFSIYGPNTYTPNSTATQQAAGSATYNWITDDQSLSSYLDYTWQFRYTAPATAGSNTTASIQSQNITFAGASPGVTTAPSPTVQTFSGLSGAASSMTYSVSTNNTLSYSYSY